MLLFKQQPLLLHQNVRGPWLRSGKRCESRIVGQRSVALVRVKDLCYITNIGCI